MDPKKWGPGLWFFLHTLTFNYPSLPTWTEKKIMNDFLFQLEYIIPCIHCRTHYKNYLVENPPLLENRTEFVLWMIVLHNNINAKLGKPVKTKEEVVKLYQDFYSNQYEYKLTHTKPTLSSNLSSCCKNHTIRVAVIVSLLWILIGCLYYYKKIPTIRRK